METNASFTPTEAIRLIEFINGLGLLVIGIYMVGPWYVILPEAAAFGFIAETSAVSSKVLAAFYAVTGIGLMYGAWKDTRKFRLVFQWMGFSGMVVIVATRLSLIGLFPLVWTWQAISLITLGVIALSRRRG